MHQALFYNKRHKKAFVVLGYCKDFNQTIMEIELFETYSKIKLPKNDVEFKIIDKHQFEGMTVVAFPLHPSITFDKPEWETLTPDNAHLLIPRKYEIDS